MRVCWAVLLAMLSWASEAAPTYRVDYRIGFDPARKEASVVIEVESGKGRLHSLRFTMDPKRYRDIVGDGEVVRKGDSVTWTLPKSGGHLSYRYRIDHRRKGGGYDARITPEFAIVRGDDLVPRATARSSRGARSQATLRADLPAGWNGLETAWQAITDERVFAVDDPDRSFDRPTGWIMAGDLGVRRDVVGANAEVCARCIRGWCGGDCMGISVAAPKGDIMRRNDTLAIVHATAPEMRAVFGALPEKILIVGAGDPMWRGGLSGPRSLFLHPDRPLISENGTSTLVHELTHVITRLHAEPGDDWIVEGIAEFYSMALLNRAGLLSDARLERGLAWMRNHGRTVKRLHTSRSAGPRTARAVVLFAALDAEIRQRTREERSLDEVARALRKRREVSLSDLREISERVIGAPAKTLDTPLLD